MERYLIESVHSEADCHHVVEQFIFHGVINRIDWGCEDGIHIGWAIVEGDDKDMALLVVPPLLRSKAKVTRLVKFSPEMLEQAHSKSQHKQEEKR